MFKFFVLVVVIATIAMSSAFAPAKAKYTGVSTTKLFEVFQCNSNDLNIVVMGFVVDFL